MSDAVPEGLLSALKIMPPYRGLVFRGCPANAGFVRDNQVTVVPLPVSGTRNLGVLGPVGDIYAIASSTGRDLSPFSTNRAEEEIVFQPGTMFAIARSIEAEGRAVRIVFEFVPGQQIGPDEVERFTVQVRGSLAALPVPGARAERFIGDLAIDAV